MIKTPFCTTRYGAIWLLVVAKRINLGASVIVGFGRGSDMERQ